MQFVMANSDKALIHILRDDISMLLRHI